MCTQRKPRGSLPSNRIRNSGNAVRRKRIVASMSRTKRFACSSRTVTDYLQNRTLSLQQLQHLIDLRRWQFAVVVETHVCRGFAIAAGLVLREFSQPRDFGCVLLGRF